MTTPSQPGSEGAVRRSQRCPTCLSAQSDVEPGVPCPGCCDEFRERARLSRDGLRRLAADVRGALRGLLVALVVLVALLVSVSITVWQLRGAVPFGVAVAWSTVHIGVLLLSLWVCLGIDATVRELPRAPKPLDVRWHRLVRRFEDRIPGATLAILALWMLVSIGLDRRSEVLMTLYALLACATAATTAALLHRIADYQRMADTAAADPAQRSACWHRAKVPRRAVIASLLWLAGTGAVCVMQLADSVPAPLAAWRTVVTALVLSTILWFAAFLDARAHLRRWLRG